jgi:hypothetical protein
MSEGKVGKHVDSKDSDGNSNKGGFCYDVGRVYLMGLFVFTASTVRNTRVSP